MIVAQLNSKCFYKNILILRSVWLSMLILIEKIQDRKPGPLKVSKSMALICSNPGKNNFLIILSLPLCLRVSIHFP